MDGRLGTAPRAILVVVAYGLTVLASCLAGSPANLPGVAFDWTLLFYLERAGALLAVIGTLILVGWRTARGEFPTRMGQIEYAVESASASERLQLRIAFIEAKQRELEEYLAASEHPEGK